MEPIRKGKKIKGFLLNKQHTYARWQGDVDVFEASCCSLFFRCSPYVSGPIYVALDFFNYTHKWARTEVVYILQVYYPRIRQRIDRLTGSDSSDKSLWEPLVRYRTTTGRIACPANGQRKVAEGGMGQGVEPPTCGAR
jgi:hypothetical protein